MTLVTMNIEDAKLDIINWVKKIHDERLIYKLEQLRVEQLDFNNELTEAEKERIIKAIGSLEED